MEEQDFNLIDAYLSGKLSSEERKEVESRTESDHDFKEAFVLQTKAVIATKQEYRTKRKAELLQEFDSIESDLKPKSIVRPLAVWLTAAAAVLAFLIIYSNWTAWKYPSPNKLFAQHINEVEIPWEGVRNTAETTDLILQQAEEAYESGNFEKALELLSQAIEEKNGFNASKEYFLKGLILMKQGFDNQNSIKGFQEAYDQFSQVSEGSLFAKDALWYQALCLLKVDKMEDGKAILNQIEGNPNHPRQEDAKSMLAALAQG